MEQVTLRPMEVRDLDGVNLVLSKAFSKARLEDGYAEWHVPLCRLGFLHMYLAANPQGCFVAERRGRIIGYVFSRRWGRIGWFGPLSVTPEEAGKGVGRRLVEQAVEHLVQAGARTIGLETNPRSYRNLGFYTKLGFRVTQLAVDVGREIGDGAVLPVGYSTFRLGRASAEERSRLGDALQELCRAVAGGADYRQEADLLLNHSYGDALFLFHKHDPVGVALAHTEPYSEKEERFFLKVYVLLLHPSRPLQDLKHFITALELWAREEFLRGVTLRVLTRHSEALPFVLEEEFNVVHTDLRMVLRGFEEEIDSETIHFSKWE